MKEGTMMIIVSVCVPLGIFAMIGMAMYSTLPDTDQNIISVGLIVIATFMIVLIYLAFAKIDNTESQKTGDVNNG